MKMGEMPVRLASRTWSDRWGSRERFDEWHSQFRGVPDAYIPWPYRNPEWDEPTECPRCGRLLVQYVWGDGPYEWGYLTVACAGWLQLFARRFPSSLFWMNHWEMTLDQATRAKFRKST